MVPNEKLEHELEDLTVAVNATKMQVQALEMTTKCLTESHHELSSRLRIAENGYASYHCLSESLTSACAKHARNLEYLQFQQRTKNLIVHNVKDAFLHNYSSLVDGIVHLFNVNNVPICEDHIESARRIGAPGGPDQPVKITFISSKYKRIIFKHVKNLRELGVSVANDLSKEQREQRKILNLYRKRLNEIGKKTYLRDTKLIHENVVYSVHTLPRLLADLGVDPHSFSELQVATKVNGAVVYIALESALREPRFLEDCEIVKPSKQMCGVRAIRKPLKLESPTPPKPEGEKEEEREEEAAHDASAESDAESDKSCNVIYDPRPPSAGKTGGSVDSDANTDSEGSARVSSSSSNDR